MIEVRRRRDLMEALRHEGVSDERVLKAIEAVPREVFVSPSFGDQSYENTALPIDCGQTISQPLVVGLMSQFLDVGPRMKVLEVGTGSGYQTAVLSRLCLRVYSIERFQKLLRQAEARFRQLDISNITARFGDGMKGWPEQAPFDRIMVTAAAEDMPTTLFGQLKEGGVMVVPVNNTAVDKSLMLGEGEAGLAVAPTEQVLVRVRKQNGAPVVERLDPVRFVPLLPGTVSDNG